MKKILTLFAVVGLMAFSSCTGSDGPAGEPGQDGIGAQAFEIKNINLGRVADNEYNLKSTFQFEVGGNLFDDETVLVYRLTGTVNPTTPVWQLIPRTIYLDNGNELDYDFDFSKVDFIITARGTYNLLNTPQYIDNQTFRIVIIPAAFSTTGKSVNKADYSDYNAVIKQFNIDDSNIKRIN